MKLNPKCWTNSRNNKFKKIKKTLKIRSQNILGVIWMIFFSFFLLWSLFSEILPFVLLRLQRSSHNDICSNLVPLGSWWLFDHYCEMKRDVIFLLKSDHFVFKMEGHNNSNYREKLFCTKTWLSQITLDQWSIFYLLPFLKFI